MVNEEAKNRIRHSLRIRILIVVVSIVLVVMMFPRGESLEFEVSVGSIWIQDDLIASATFEVLKDPEDYRRELQEATAGVNPIFVMNKQVEVEQLDTLKSYNSRIVSIFDTILKENTSQFLNPTFLTDDGFRRLLNLRRQENLIANKGKIRLTDIFRISEQLIDRIYRRGMIDRSLEEIQKDSITLREGKFERDVAKRNYLDDAAAKNFIQLFIRNNLNTTEDIQNAAEEYAYHFVKPNINFSKELTSEEVERAKNKIPRNVGIVNENERIVAKHDRITPETKLKIDSYKIAKGESTGFWGNFAQKPVDSPFAIL